LDVEQDHNFAGCGCGTRCRIGEHFGATLHSIERIEPESLSVQLLRKQNLLRDIAEQHRTSRSAAREVWFRSTECRNFAFRDRNCGTESSRGDLVVFLEPRVHGAFAADIRAHLHSPHLIQTA
jgi:hypothetical protein